MVHLADGRIVGVFCPGSQHPGGVVNLLVLNTSSSRTCTELVPCLKDW